MSRDRWQHWRALWPLGRGLAVRRGPGQLWRRICVVAATMIATSLVLGAGAVLHALVAERLRSATELGVIFASSPANTDLLMMNARETISGHDVVIRYVEPADEATQPVLPPGLDHMPAPGAAVVSPALAALIATDEVAARRFPQSVVIGWDGVGFGEEAFAYFRPAVPTLGLVDDVTRVEAGTVHYTDTGVARVAAFGRPGPLGSGLSRPVRLPLGYVSIGLVALLLFPALLLIAVGGSIGSATRRHRLSVLRALGCTHRQLRHLVIIETACLVVPSTAIMTVVVAIALPLVHSVPVIGYRVVPGDLALPWPAYLGAVGLVSVFATLVTGRSVRRAVVANASPRPIVQRSRLRWWIALPLGAGLTTIGAVTLVGNRLAADLSLIGSVLLVLGVPLLLGTIVYLTGSIQARSRSITASLAGASLRWRPEQVAATLMPLSALVVLAAGILGYAASIDYSYLSPPRPEITVTSLRSPVPLTVSQRESIIRQTPATVLEARETDNGILLGASCGALQNLVPAMTCSAGTHQLTDRDAQIFAAATSLSVAGLFNAPNIKSNTMLVLGRDTPVTQQDEIAQLAHLAVPVIVVSTDNARPYESALSRWLSGGLYVATATLFLAVVLGLLDRLIHTDQQVGRLARLGVSPNRIGRIQTARFVTPFIAMALVASAAGLLACRILAYRADMPWVHLTVVLAILIAVGCGGTMSSLAVRGLARTTNLNPGSSLD